MIDLFMQEFHNSSVVRAMVGYLMLGIPVVILANVHLFILEPRREKKREEERARKKREKESSAQAD